MENEINQDIHNPIPNTDLQPAAAAPAQGSPCRPRTGSVIAMTVMFVALAVLYVLHFASPKSSLVNPNATAPVVAKDGALKIAYINTDTLMAKYQYAIDLQKEMEQYQASKQNSLQQQMTQFQTDYQNYLKTGADLTLTQQKAKEEELQARMQKLQGLEGQYAQQIQEKTIAESQKMTQAVYAFIAEYNKANQQFDLILARSFSSSPVLYGDPGMDITDEIVQGLNAEYANYKSR